MSNDSPATSSAITGENEQEQPQSADNLSSKMEKMNISSSSFSIWPPTSRTRDAVINRLIETLSNPSVLSKRYGSIPSEEASSIAKSIEEESYDVAASKAAANSTSVSSIDEGIEILQVYSKEISTRMLAAVKSKGATPAPDPDASEISAPPESDRATVASEEVSSSIGNESSA